MADARALFEAHEHRVFRYLRRAVGQDDDARDLTQDVYVRMAQAGVPQGDNVCAWVFRIARNLAIDYHRQRTRRAEVPLPAITAGAASQHVTAAVNQALAALDAIDRDVFLMRELAGLGYADIANACDLTPDAVRSRIHRARLELRQRLAAPIGARRAHALRRVPLPTE